MRQPEKLNCSNTIQQMLKRTPTDTIRELLRDPDTEEGIKAYILKNLLEIVKAEIGTQAIHIKGTQKIYTQNKHIK